VAAIRKHTALPVVVGFGISSRDQVRQVAQAADGVVVGSALVNVIKAGLYDRAGVSAKLGVVAADLTAGVH
jgi:tryptophan synthase alpha chain